MAYKALYRTYRPQSFDEVYGQKHITKTFKNALKNSMISHAYLFSGPRGTGKTSVAKIIAKAVNCKQAPIDNPCNECDVCVGITNGSNPDVIEIDAASNNGVDEIREIRDKVKYLPATGQYKVYIIDEVHMLSTGAFNALLKTLEEPPKHVIFILATTEPHKIPSTIMSRCQRFDFRSISKKHIIQRINEIIESESVRITDEAVYIISELAEGGMRDALSLLDQAMSYTSNEITEEDIRDITGSLTSHIAISLAEAIYNKKVYQGLELVSELVDLGKEPQKIVNDMIQFYRDILVFKNANDSKTDKHIYSNERFVDLSRKESNPKVFDYIDILFDALNNMKRTHSTRALLELAVVKLSEVRVSEMMLLEKIKKLESKIDELANRKPQNVVVQTVSKQEEKVAVEETEIEQVEEVVIQEETDDIENTYDVSFVKDVLVSAMNKKEKISKEEVMLIWATLLDRDLNGDFQVAKVLSESNVVATGDTGMVLEYPNEINCNTMMTPATKASALKIIKEAFGFDYDYIALPKMVWVEKRNEFLQQFKNGEEIELSPIEYKGLLDVASIEEIEEKETSSPVINKALNLFGEEIVEID